MVLHKRLEYGYQRPPTPRATRSPRKRSIPRSKNDDNQICAFDLFPEANNSELVCRKSSFVSPVSNYCSTEHPHSQGDAGSGSASVITTSDASVKIGSSNQIERDRNNYLAGSELPVSKVYASCKIDGEDKNHAKNESSKPQRPLRDYPIKKRRLYDYSSFGEDRGSTPKISNEDGPVSFRPMTGDSRVKLKIKAFRVPELFFEIPETDTVGSLKRAVMEAVTAILGDGLHVGILQHGKKIGDDNRTLLQTGISHNNKSDALGFILENNNSHAPKPLPRYTKRSMNFVESEHDSAPSSDSRDLVAMPSKTAEALSMVLMRKPKRSESARRIRRPFTVSEVEALVQAVEKLGTGRWRDVKLRAFDNAKHRTYVDLKDKWKTLVHTARISPQQRRGEPVPQELLDRVLLAHAYWSQQQAKLQLKQHSKLAFSESLIRRN